MSQTLSARRRRIWFDVEQFAPPVAAQPVQDCESCDPEWANICPHWSEDCEIVRDRREIEDRRYAASNGTL